MALPPLLRVPGPDPFSRGISVGYGQMAIGEKVRYEVTRDAQGVLVTVVRTTANGIISGSARVAGTTVTKPSSQVTFGRIPTSRPPDEEPPPDPPPGTPGTVPNWHPFAGTFTVGAPDITTTSDGSQTYVTMNSDDGYVDDGAVGRVFTGSVSIKGTGSSIGKTAYLIFRERRSDGSAPSNDGAAASIVLTGAYQTLTSTYTATELNSAMDLRITLRGVSTGEAFIVSAVPTWSYQDPVSSPPVAQAGWSPVSPVTNQTVTFTTSSYGNGSALVLYQWDMDNDGVFETSSSTALSVTYSWPNAGTFYWRHRVTDGLGRTSTITTPITISSGTPPANNPPVASFTFSPTNPIATDTVTFTDTSSDSDGTIASRAWDLDNDGAYDDSTSATPTKVFGAAGTYTVGLQVTDDDGATGATSRTIVVADTAPTPTADPFTKPYYPLALINSKITSLGVRSDSAAAVSRLQACVASGKVRTAVTAESPTIYISNHATQNLYSTPYGNWYVPSNAVNGGGSDRPLVIRDANHPNYGPYSELRIWKANIDHGARTITSSGPGSGVFHFNNDGVRYGGIHSVGRPIVGTGPGNGLNYTAGMILVADVVNGVIPHTMRFAYGPSTGPGTISSPTTSGKVDPATKSDQAGTLSGAVPMGTRFRLKSSVDITTRTVPGKSNSSTEWRFLQIFLKACQDYGIMVSDGTGSGPNFYFESDFSANPSWTSVIGAYDPTSSDSKYGYILRDNTVSDAYSGQRTAFSGVPWGEFEVVSNTTENL